MVKLNNISFRYNEQSDLLIEDLNFTAKQGDIIAVKGNSGSGKTTLLNIICGVIPKIFSGDLTGSVVCNGTPISSLSLPETAPLISLLMQQPDNQLFFPLVEQELAFAPENMRLSTEDILNRIDDVLTKLEIIELRNISTSSLSFGQKKIVTLASIITLSPKIYLLDEPFTGLSEKYIQLVSNVIKDEARIGKIVFIAGHSEDILNLSHYTIELGK